MKKEGVGDEAGDTAMGPRPDLHRLGDCLHLLSVPHEKPLGRPIAALRCQMRIEASVISCLSDSASSVY